LKDVLDSSGDTLIDDEKNFASLHGFDNLNKGIHGASTFGDSTTITSGFKKFMTGCVASLSNA